MRQLAEETQLKLARWVESDPLSLQVVRDLSPEEAVAHQRYTPLVGAALERLVLFKALSLNYNEWKLYIDSLLSAQPLGDEDARLNVNRLLLNYLTCAYTIREHFQVSLKHRFRNDPAKLKEYDGFIERLCDGSWATAFFFDFRGYVQHRGWGIEHYNRNVKRTAVTLTITCNAETLVTESRDWHRSKLKGSEGTLEIVPLLAQFHVQMLQSYARFVANLIFPEFGEAAKFYASLTHEALRDSKGYKMVFSKGEPKIDNRGDRTAYEYKLTMVPNDLFREAGIIPAQYV